MTLNIFDVCQFISIMDVQINLSLAHGHLLKLAPEPFWYAVSGPWWLLCYLLQVTAGSSWNLIALELEATISSMSFESFLWEMVIRDHNLFAVDVLCHWWVIISRPFSGKNKEKCFVKK